MKTKECPGCAMDVDADEEVCPICGYEFPHRSRNAQIVVWILILMLLWWLVF